MMLHRPRRCRLPLFVFGLLPVAFCLLSACGPNRGSTIQASAASGYCPVCKMKVNAADDWTAEIYYNDGTKLMFESPGDMLTFYSSPDKFRASPIQQDRANITRISLRDYQTREAIDARQATLVVNSRIEGPMGPDFLPFAKSADAAAFVGINGGRTVSLAEVTPEMVHNVRGSL